MSPPRHAGVHSGREVSTGGLEWSSNLGVSMRQLMGFGEPFTLPSSGILACAVGSLASRHGKGCLWSLMEQEVTEVTAA